MQENPYISVLGAAFLAGLQSGFFRDLAAIKSPVHARTLEKAGNSRGPAQKYKKWMEGITN